MQKAFFWICSLALLIGGAFTGGKAWKAYRFEQLIANSKMGTSYQPVSFSLENRSFVIVISGYNNGAFVQKTLQSVFSQKYDDYRLIYIDDASTDGSFEAARDVIYSSGKMIQTTIVQNETSLGQLANLSRAIESCEDREIVVVLNGEDWLSHEWVLSRLNQYYANPDLWLTVGQYCEYPTYQKGEFSTVRQSEWKSLREVPFSFGHLKAFYAGLFKKIAKEDLIHHDRFFSERFDLAILLPMLEMAKDHFQFLDEVLYVVNRQGSSQPNQKLEAIAEKTIRSLRPYQAIETLAFCYQQEEEI